MRKDIKVNINDGSFIPNNINEDKKMFEVSEVGRDAGGDMLDMYLYLEVIIDNLEFNKAPEFIYLPYTPIDKKSYIRMGSKNNLGFVRYLKNPVTNSQWFKICVNNKHIPVSSLPIINKYGRYSVLLDYETGNLNFYSMDEFDFSIDSSLYQDAQLLIKSYVGSNTRHPLSGVGIQRYINSPVIDKRLNQRILDELNSDGIVPDEVILNDGLVTLNLNENKSLGYEEEQQIR